LEDKEMIKLFLSAFAYIRRLRMTLHAAEEYLQEQEVWRRDPLAHPDIRRMSERQIADLPFNSRPCGG
jgi:hypothetical protein